MKRLFWGIFALLTIVACSDDSLFYTPKVSAIKFGNVATRAEVSSASEITSFKLFGEMNLGEENSPEAAQWVALFDGGELEYVA